MMIRIVLLSLLFAASAAPHRLHAQSLAPADSSRLFDFFRLYNQAAGAGAYPLARRYLDSALLLSPDFSQVRAAHVRASLRVDMPDAALADLERMLAQRLVQVRNSMADSLVRARLDGDARFERLEAGLRVFDEKRGSYTEFAQLADKTLVPEGTAFDARTRTLYVSSIYRRKIVAIDANGQVRDFVSAKAHGLLSVIGLTIDARRRVLYACSSFNPRNTVIDTADLGDRRTAMFAFDLGSGRLIGKYTHPDAVFFNDLAVDRDGTVYVTDSDGNAVYRLSPAAGRLERFIDRPVLYSPNGIALDPRRRQLYIGAFLGGILQVNLDSGQRRWLTAPDSISLAGTDGLEFYKNSLIINSPLEHRAVRRLFLNAGRTAVTREAILAYDPDTIRETTTGALAGRNFLFIANSGLDAYEATGALNTEKLRPALILRCALE